MATASEIAAPVLGVDSAGMLLSPEEFDAVTEYDDCYRYELVHGVLVVHAIPAPAESDLNGELEYLLRKYQKEHPQGKSLDKTMAERYVRLVDSRRKADRVIWAGLGRQPNTKFDVPTIVVEFVSRGRRSWPRDYEEKRREYLSVGVREYWIIDRFARTMTIFRDPQHGPAERILKSKDVYRPTLLPGFELSLKSLLLAADDWRDED
jgi:Uma2 family endonuclease